MGLRAGLDTEVRGKISCFCRGSNLNRFSALDVAKCNNLVHFEKPCTVTIKAMYHDETV
jgi:hypothetical protein